MYPNRLYGIISILVYDALSLLFELCDDFIVPPLLQITILIILSACVKGNNSFHTKAKLDKSFWLV